MLKTGSALYDALGGLFWAVGALDMHLHGATAVATTAKERLQCVNGSTTAAIIKLIRRLEGNQMWLPGDARELASGGMEKPRGQVYFYGKQFSHLPFQAINRNINT